MTKTRERYVYTSWPRFGDLLKLWNNCLLQYVALFRLARKSVHIRYTCRDQLSKFLDAQVVWIPLLPCDLASATQEEWLLYIWCSEFTQLSAFHPHTMQINSAVLDLFIRCTLSHRIHALTCTFVHPDTWTHMHMQFPHSLYVSDI